MLQLTAAVVARWLTCSVGCACGTRKRATSLRARRMPGRSVDHWTSKGCCVVAHELSVGGLVCSEIRLFFLSQATQAHFHPKMNASPRRRRPQVIFHPHHSLLPQILRLPRWIAWMIGSLSDQMAGMNHRPIRVLSIFLIRACLNLLVLPKF